MKILSRLSVSVALAASLLVPSSAALAADVGRVTSDTCPSAARHGFGDVASSSVHASAVACVKHYGVTVGTTPSTFTPSATLRRDQLASFLARALEAGGVDLPAASKVYFSDIDGSVHAAAIRSLAEAGIVPAGSGRFSPSTQVSRAEMAQTTAAALRYAGVLKATRFNAFNDDDGRPEEAAINQLAVAGVVAGRTPGVFSPDALLRRDQMAAFLIRSLDLIVDGGAAPENPLPPPPPKSVRSPEGFVVAGGDGPVVGTGGATTRYSVEIADGLGSRQDIAAFSKFVETTLSDRAHGWTSRGGHRLQRVDDPSQARVRVLLASPATVDRLCGQVGLRTGGIYSCWNGRFAAINSDRWFGGVPHVSSMSLYRAYVINHEVGHGLGHGHRSCPGSGRLAPVMMQLTKSTYGCVPNALPYP